MSDIMELPEVRAGCVILAIEGTAVVELVVYALQEVTRPLSIAA